MRILASGSTIAYCVLVCSSIAAGCGDSETPTTEDASSDDAAYTGEDASEGGESDDGIDTATVGSGGADGAVDTDASGSGGAGGGASMDGTAAEASAAGGSIDGADASTTQDAGGGCIPGRYYCGGDTVSGEADSLYRCTAGNSVTLVQQCPNGCSVNGKNDDSCNGDGRCIVGGYYCGGDVVSGEADSLYQCTGGTSGTLVQKCPNGCSVNPGRNDSCKGDGGCVVGGYYCGGDKVSGEADSLYQCTGGSSGTLVQKCPKFCSINPGTDDSCN